jgi:hypothetical protein
VKYEVGDQVKYKGEVYWIHQAGGKRYTIAKTPPPIENVREKDLSDF